jgi:hypothetical protein
VVAIFDFNRDVSPNDGVKALLSPVEVPRATLVIVGIVPGCSSPLTNSLASALVILGSWPYSGMGSPKSPGSILAMSSNCGASALKARSSAHVLGIGVAFWGIGSSSSVAGFSSSTSSSSSSSLPAGGSGLRGE